MVALAWTRDGRIGVRAARDSDAGKIVLVNVEVSLRLPASVSS